MRDLVGDVESMHFMRVAHAAEAHAVRSGSSHGTSPANVGRRRAEAAHGSGSDKHAIKRRQSAAA